MAVVFGAVMRYALSSAKMNSQQPPLIMIPVPVQHGDLRYSMGKYYIHALIKAGATPLLVPVSLNDAEQRRLYDLCDGVLLTGGADCDPKRFGESKHEKTDGIDPARDHAEILLTQWAVAEDKPIFGICRGVQMMNVALGGSLIQDIPSQVQTQQEHRVGVLNMPREKSLHTTAIDANSRIASIIKNSEVGVNSFHHQALKKVAPGLVVTSRSNDGIIESVEMPNKQFVLGVQWHPEDMADLRDDMQALFDEFVKTCKK